MRFTLDYNTSVDSITKKILVDNCKASMVSPYGDSIQFCLVDVLSKLVNGFENNAKNKTPNSSIIGSLTAEEFTQYVEDIDHLLDLNVEGVNYIEICF